MISIVNYLHEAEKDNLSKYHTKYSKAALIGSGIGASAGASAAAIGQFQKYIDNDSLKSELFRDAGLAALALGAGGTYAVKKYLEKRKNENKKK